MKSEEQPAHEIARLTRAYEEGVASGEGRKVSAAELLADLKARRMRVPSDHERR
jgi:antitoxin ParD1/3/4